MEPIQLLARKSFGIGVNVPKYDKMEDFAFAKVSDTYLHNYGRNIYEKGERIGYCLDIRIPGYRGLPINQIHKICFEVDGQWIPEEWMYVWYQDRDFPVSAIGTGRFDNEWMWKYQDYLRVLIRVPGGIEQGVHNVKYGLALRDHYSTTCYCEKDVTIV